jgi:uncharacterized protein YajQ (UPF0234 family)
VQASIMDDLVRVTGKKIDELQSDYSNFKKWNLGFHFHYENIA